MASRSRRLPVAVTAALACVALLGACGTPAARPLQGLQRDVRAARHAAALVQHEQQVLGATGVSLP